MAEFEVRRKAAGERKNTTRYILLGALAVVSAVATVILVVPAMVPPPPPPALDARLADLAPVTGVDELGADGWAVRLAPEWPGKADPNAQAQLCEALSTRLGRTGTQTVEVTDNDGIRIVTCR